MAKNLSRNRLGFWLSGGLVLALSAQIFDLPALSLSTSPLFNEAQEGFIQPDFFDNQGVLNAQADQVCSGNLETLVTQLLNDLPSYTNRVIQRSKSKNNDNLPFILLTGQADLTPLKFSQLQYQPIFEDTTKQVFFTVLERHYSSTKAYQSQRFYWAFLTLTNRGWQLSLLMSQLAAKNKNDPPLPPIDVSQDAIAQGIQLWLRDCQAGTLAHTFKQ